MDDKYNFRSGQHRLVMENREHTEVSGVVHVESFDDEEVVVETELGLLALKGENLHIKHLNLEQGEIIVDGLILELAYAENKARGKSRSLFERLFK